MPFTRKEQASEIQSLVLCSDPTELHQDSRDFEGGSDSLSLEMRVNKLGKALGSRGQRFFSKSIRSSVFSSTYLFGSLMLRPTYLALITLLPYRPRPKHPNPDAVWGRNRIKCLGACTCSQRVNLSPAPRVLGLTSVPFQLNLCAGILRVLSSIA